MNQCSRRNFLRAGLAAGVLVGTHNLPLRAAKGSATDWVTLGKSDVKVTRSGIWHRHDERQGAARSGPGTVHAPGALRL